MFLFHFHFKKLVGLGIVVILSEVLQPQDLSLEKEQAMGFWLHSL